MAMCYSCSPDLSFLNGDGEIAIPLELGLQTGTVYPGMFTWDSMFLEYKRLERAQCQIRTQATAARIRAKEFDQTSRIRQQLEVKRLQDIAAFFNQALSYNANIALIEPSYLTQLNADYEKEIESLQRNHLLLEFLLLLKKKEADEPGFQSDWRYFGKCFLAQPSLGDSLPSWTESFQRIARQFQSCSIHSLIKGVALKPAPEVYIYVEIFRAYYLKY